MLPCPIHDRGDARQWVFRISPCCPRREIQQGQQTEGGTLILLFSDKADQYGQFLLGSGMGVITTALAAGGSNDQGKAKNKGGVK